ncbi:MAG: MFS transporter, partial [Bacteroidota bacterium]
MDTIKNFTNNQRSWRYRIFAITWFAYAGFYFGRKNFSVAMPSMANELGYSHQDLAMVISAFSFTYMAGQFLNGFLADRFSPRVIVGIGLIMAAIANFFMGWTGTLSVFIFLMGVNGLAQSTGWPGLLKNMSAWFGQKERGVVLSWWSTCYVVGAFGATIFATYCIT